MMSEITLKAQVNEETLLPMMFLALSKLQNICCGHKMFLNKIRNIFCVPDTKFVSATMCPRLPGPWKCTLVKGRGLGSLTSCLGDIGKMIVFYFRCSTLLLADQWNLEKNLWTSHLKCLPFSPDHWLTKRVLIKFYTTVWRTIWPFRLEKILQRKVK